MTTKLKYHIDKGGGILHPYLEIVCDGCNNINEFDMRLASCFKTVYCRLCNEPLDFKRGY